MEHWTEQKLESANRELMTLSALERIEWAYKTFASGLVMSTSFGIQSALMLHLATRVYPKIPIVFIDTGYLFRDTYLFAHNLIQQLNLNIKKYHPLMSAAEQEAIYGQMWEQGEEGMEKYNFIRKVEPMNRALIELNANSWMAGLRRGQATTRGMLRVMQQQNRIIKLHPVVDWTEKDVYEYLTTHDLPYHPLWNDGYVSVGDTHSTTRLAEGMNPEDTRHGGMKRECGIHELSNRLDFQI